MSADIKSVESRFGLDLAAGINLVSYDQVCNALTCEGDSDIWVYADLLASPRTAASTSSASSWPTSTWTATWKSWPLVAGWWLSAAGAR